MTPNELKQQIKAIKRTLGTVPIGDEKTEVLLCQLAKKQLELKHLQQTK
jgi:hypothetical protein